MGKKRGKTTGTGPAAIQTAAEAESTAPASGRIVRGRAVVRTPTSGQNVLKRSAAKSGGASSKGIAGRRAPRLTRIQKAASQTEPPKIVDDGLQASDADVLRIARAIATQRAELMDRLAQ
jgi:hypothetical protein